jgi:hypothetical protein
VRATLLTFSVLGLLLMPSAVVAQALDESEGAKHEVEFKGTNMFGPFHPRNFVEGWELEGAALSARRWGSARTQRGWELSLAGSSQTVHHGLSLSGTAGPVFRYLGDGDVSATLSRHRVVGGLSLGAFEILGGCGFSTLTVDRITHRWGLGLLSPLTTASIALRLGTARLELSGYMEYLWRWNASDYFVRGISIAVRVKR